jgi:16S rRNA U516 pseudouridylate synthase RsuA-like enzyme
MVKSMGGTVLKLKRIRYGAVRLGDLREGEITPLSPGEMDALSREETS